MGIIQKRKNMFPEVELIIQAFRQFILANCPAHRVRYQIAALHLKINAHYVAASPTEINGIR